MYKLDNALIGDRFAAASFSFYTEEEIMKLSVKNINNQAPFDHLNNPTDQGIYDKAMGVSPFDHRGQYDYNHVALNAYSVDASHAGQTATSAQDMSATSS